MSEQEFLELIDRHQAIIHKICRLYRETKEDREDLFQEIVYQLWRSVPGFNNRAKFSTWMYRIALTTAIAPFRKKNLQIVYTPELPEGQEGTTEGRTGELQERLLEVIKRLDPADRAIILLYLEELSYKEIAEVTGITENNVGVKLNRIKNKIHQLLKI
jgi:RNA polymerase sigma factor (sigma-70 family)